VSRAILKSMSALAIALLDPVIGHAQSVDAGLPDGRFELRLGIQAFNTVRTRLRVDSSTLGIGTEIDLEQDLALPEEINVTRLDAEVRFGRRQGLAVSHYDVRRTGMRPLSFDLRYGDEVFAIGTTIVSEFDQEILQLAYRYRMLHKPRATLDGSFGLHTMRLNSTVHSLDDSRISMRQADAPLPVLGLAGAYQFGRRWRLVGTAEWFDIRTGDLQGLFKDVRAAVEHDTFDHAGFGFGINSVSFDFDARERSWEGLIEVNFNATMAYVFGRFGTRD